MLKNPNNAPEVSQYIAHYAKVEPTIMLTKTDMRHEETQLHYHRVQPFQFYIHVFRSESGYQLTDQPFTSP